MNFSKKLITLIIAANIIFTAIILYIFYKIGNEPSSLIIAWFGFWGVEVWALARIKQTELKGEEHYEHKEH